MEADVRLNWSEGYGLYRAWIGGQTIELTPAELDALAMRSQIYKGIVQEVDKLKEMLELERELE